MSAPSDVPGVTPPSLVLTSTDKGGLVVVMTALAMCFVLVAFLIRMYVRMSVSGYQLDDFVLTLATITSCVQSSVVILQVHRGYGKSTELIEQSLISPMQKAAYAGDVLFIFTLYLSKCCVGFLYLRLTPGRGHSLAVWSIMAASTVWAIISLFLIALRCNPTHPWTNTVAQCASLFARWQFITALDIVTEVALFGMSIYVVYGLQMSMKSKGIVVGAFGLRLPVIAISAVHLYYLHMEIVSGNPTLTGSYTVVCAQLELGYGIMASSIPCLKPFMSAYEGPLRPPRKSSGHQSSGDYPFTTYGSGHSKRLRSTEAGLSTGGSGVVGAHGMVADERSLRPEQTVYQATVSHRDPTAEEGAGSIDSGDSRQMIIRKDLVIKKEVKWSVEREGEAEEVEEKGSDVSVRVAETHSR